MNLAEEFKKYASSDAFFYITLDPERALGVEDILPNYHVICPYKSWLTDALKDSGVRVFVLEEEVGLDEAMKIAEKGSYGIMQANLVKDYIAKKAGTVPALRANILVLKTSALIEDFCKSQGWNLLAPKANVAEEFENKISQFKILRGVVPFPKSRISTMEEVYNIAKSLNGEDATVIQFNRGHSGNTTFFVKSVSDIEELYKLFPKREVKISEFKKGKTYTLNCLVLRNRRVITGSISQQLTGLPEATSNPNSTVGNDWGSARNLSGGVFRKIKEMAEKSGSAMCKEGYAGLFGIDVLVENSSAGSLEDDSNEVYFIELNTHQPASVSLEAKIHRNLGKVPLLGYFVLDSAGEAEISEEDLPPLILPINARQIIYRNKSSQVMSRGQILSEFSGKPFISRVLEVKPNEEVWREQAVDL